MLKIYTIQVFRWLLLEEDHILDVYLPMLDYIYVLMSTCFLPTLSCEALVAPVNIIRSFLFLLCQPRLIVLIISRLKYSYHLNVEIRLFSFL